MVNTAAEPLASTGRDILYIYSTDFTTGGVQRVYLTQGRVDPRFLPAHADAIVRVHPDTFDLWVVNRLAGNHLSYASADLEKILGQLPLAENSNPQDILFLPEGESYVSTLAGRHLLRVSSNGKASRAAVDLSTWGDADGFAEPGYLHWSGGRALVAVQQLDKKTYRPWGPGYLLPVNPQTDAVDEQSVVRLARPNPFTEFRTWGGDFFLGEAGVLDRARPVLDGGIERFDGQTFQSKGLVVEENELGGDILDFEILDRDRAVAIVGDPQTQLVAFNPQTGKKTKVWSVGVGFQFSHLVADRDRSLVFVADRTMQRPCVRVFDWNGREWKKHRIDLQLPPFRLELVSRKD